MLWVMKSGRVVRAVHFRLICQKYDHDPEVHQHLN